MADNRNRYQELEHFLSAILFLDLGIFILYMIVAGGGLMVAKIISAIAALLISAFCLWILIRSKEAFRQRSLWLTCAFAAIPVCTIVSLITGFPGP